MLAGTDFGSACSVQTVYFLFLLKMIINLIKLQVKAITTKVTILTAMLLRHVQQ